MATEKELKRAKDAFDKLCETLDEMNWHYKKDEEALVVRLGVEGDDFPMEFLISMDAERQLIRIASLLPFKMSEEKHIDGALATSFANYRLADGSFDYNPTDGRIIFRMTSSFRESLIGKELLKYMIDTACLAVDKYNDQFFMISKGVLKIEDFVKRN